MSTQQRAVEIAVGSVRISADLTVPRDSADIVIFADGSGSSRHSPRNQHVAHVLQQANLATLLMDLLTEEEETLDQRTAHLRFNIRFLSDRLVRATDWMTEQSSTRHFQFGYFGASTGAAAALVAAAERANVIRAVVSRGGRPDLASHALPSVRAPTLLIVGGNDARVIAMNREAIRQLRCESKIEIIPGAGHLFEEPGALDQVARLAAGWFLDHLHATAI